MDKIEQSNKFIVIILFILVIVSGIIYSLYLGEVTHAYSSFFKEQVLRERIPDSCSFSRSFTIRFVSAILVLVKVSVGVQ